MHTTGPWAVHKNKGEAVPYAICDKGTFLIGEIYGSTIGDPDEVLANARLIAAAPDLLAALESAVKALAVANIAGRSLYGAEVTESARAAIRAAKGESNG